MRRERILPGFRISHGVPIRSSANHRSRFHFLSRGGNNNRGRLDHLPLAPPRIWQNAFGAQLWPNRGASYFSCRGIARPVSYAAVSVLITPMRGQYTIAEQ